MSSSSFELRTAKVSSWQNIWTLLRRELISSTEHFVIQGLLLFECFYLLILSFITMIPWIHLEPYFFLPILITIATSTLITQERETGMLDLIKLSGVTSREFLISRFLYALILYFITAAIYLISAYVVSLYFGDYFFQIAVIFIFTIYLLLYIFLCSLSLIVGSFLPRSGYSIALGFLLIINTIFIQPQISQYYWQEYSFYGYLNKDITRIFQGYNPDMMLWGGLLLITIILLIICDLCIKKLWGALRE